jgi:phage baseplate assembly protein W
MTTPLLGFAFPFQIVNGGIARARDFEKIEDNVRHALSTRSGERIMLRTYGGGVHHRLQSPNDATLRALIRHEIEEALRVHLPDVHLTAPIQLESREHELRVVIEFVADPRDVVRRFELRIA